MKMTNDITIRFLDTYNYLLSVKKITSSKDFADKIEISSSLMTEIIKGRSNAGINPIQKTVIEFPEINAEWLLTGTGEMLNSKSKENLTIIYGKDNGKEEGKEPNVKKMSTNGYTSFTPAVVTVDSDNNDNIALVPVPLCAGYLKGYNNPSFIEKLPTFRMPGLNHGVFRMFEVEGHSMFPTLPNKSYVVGQFVENWITGIRDNQVYAVISNEVEGGLVKRCINKIKKYNNLICKSDNRRDYPTQNISPESIKEIWEIKLHLNFQLPDPADIYDRMTDLEGEVSSLEGKVSSLEKVIKQANLPLEGG